MYGRPDPQPGNFQPRFGSTNEFAAIASQEAHRDLKWFFDVYLRQADLPRLVDGAARQHTQPAMEDSARPPFPCRLMSTWTDKRQTVPMTGGHGTITLPGPFSLVTLDPDSKILRQDDAIDRFRDDPVEQETVRGRAERQVQRSM